MLPRRSMTRVHAWLPVWVSLGTAVLVVACEPPVPRRNTSPKNGVATSRQRQGDGAKEEGEGEGQDKPVSCTATCREKSKSVASIHDAHTTCVTACDEDEDCVASCDDERAADCDGSSACEKLATCLAACE